MTDPVNPDEQTILTERVDRVALIRLNRGVTNALGPACVADLARALREAREDEDIRGLVITSAGEKFLSIGWDIPHLYALDREAFRAFFRAFNEMCRSLFTMPKPTAAAIAGHAVAGGCILAICCDYRFIAEGRKLMGLNEIKLGVPVPWLADRVLRSIVGEHRAERIIAEGEFYEAARCRKMGLVDEVLPPDVVLDRAIEKVRSLDAFPAAAWALIKRSRTMEIESAVDALGPEREQEFLDHWFSDEARDRLGAAMERF